MLAGVDALQLKKKKKKKKREGVHRCRRKRTVFVGPAVRDGFSLIYNYQVAVPPPHIYVYVCIREHRPLRLIRVTSTSGKRGGGYHQSFKARYEFSPQSSLSDGQMAFQPTC